MSRYITTVATTVSLILLSVIGLQAVEEARANWFHPPPDAVMTIDNPNATFSSNNVMIEFTVITNQDSLYFYSLDKSNRTQINQRPTIVFQNKLTQYSDGSNPYTGQGWYRYTLKGNATFSVDEGEHNVEIYLIYPKPGTIPIEDGFILASASTNFSVKLSTIIENTEKIPTKPLTTTVPTASLIATASITPSSSPTITPSPTEPPTQTSTPKPTANPTQSQTPDKLQVKDFAPVTIPASVILLAIVVVILLFYFRKRRA